MREIKAYNINELSEDAKQRAYEDWLHDFDYFWDDDNRATLQAFCELFPVKVTDWEYGYRNYIRFTLTTADTYTERCYYDFTGLRLLKYIVNNYWHNLFRPKYLGYVNGKPRYSRCQREACCVLTGYCVDEDILAPLYDFLKDYRTFDSNTFEDLMKLCLENWIDACRKDYEACQEFDYFIDHAHINKYEYLEDGRMV